MIITIDGPSASGKSTVAAEVARRLNIFYLNSGYLYRAVAYMLAQVPGITDATLVAYTQRQVFELAKLDTLDYQYQDGKVAVYINGNDITAQLKTPEVDRTASVVSMNPDVRSLVTAFQRVLAQNHSLVAEGRDAGNVVFPQADLKIFLTASSAVRAERLRSDKQARGISLTSQEALAQLEERDARDSQRAVAPMQAIEDAMVIDNSTLSFEQVVRLIIALAQDKAAILPVA